MEETGRESAGGMENKEGDGGHVECLRKGDGGARGHRGGGQRTPVTSQGCSQAVTPNALTLTHLKPMRQPLPRQLVFRHAGEAVM